MYFLYGTNSPVDKTAKQERRCFHCDSRMHLFKHCPHRQKGTVNRFVDRSVTKPQSSDDHSKPQSRNSENANACMVESLEPVNSYESVVRCDNDTHDNATKSVPAEVQANILSSDLNDTSSNVVHFPDYSYSDQRRRKQIESGGGRIPARSAGKNFFSVPPPHFSVVRPHFGGALHTTGWAQRWAVIAHCLFVKKWAVAKTETRIQ